MVKWKHFSEEDIRPSALVNSMGSVSGMGSSREKLLAKKAGFVEIQCPACGAEHGEHAFVKREFNFMRCIACETVYCSPRPTAIMLDEYYCDENPLYAFWNDSIFRQTEAARRELIFKPRVDRVLNYVKEFGVEPGTLIEVGAGYGTFCVEMDSREAFKKVIAIEPTTKLAQTCRDRGLEVVEKTIERFASESSCKANVVVSFEVIEHLFAPADFLSFCRSSLCQKGLLMLSCPNINGFDMMILKDKSTAVDNEHINLFSLQGMRCLLDRSGFKPISIETPGSMDAELVRKGALRGDVDISANPFLKRVLIDEWERLRVPFQRFLAENGLSSHMLVVAENT